MNSCPWPAPAGPIVMPFQGARPRIDPQALVLPGAAVIGDVTLAPLASVWFNAVLRGDDGPISIGRGSNVQDGCILHVGTELPTVVGDWVTLGHGVHLHACRLEDETLIGSGALVLDGAVVESRAQVAAGALVAPGKVVRAGELWGGVPARKLRDLSGEEAASIKDNALWYVQRMQNYRRQWEEAP